MTPRDTIVSPARAVILAAGDGGRLEHHTTELPKPLVTLDGRSIVSYTLDALAEAGIGEAVVVVGYRARQVQEALEAQRLPLRLRFVTNPRFDSGASLSLRAARELCGDEPFLLVMADHVLSASLLQRLVAAARTPGARGRSFVAADYSERDPAYVWESTKIAVGPAGQVTAIGKALSDWQALDAGAFLLSAATWEAMDAVAEDCELSVIFGELARRGGLFATDIGGAFWYDIDTPLDLLAAAEAIASRRLLARSER